MTFIPFKSDLFKSDRLDFNKKKLTKAGWVFVAFGLAATGAAAWLGIANGNDMDGLKTGVKKLNEKYDAHAKSDSLIGLAYDPKTGKLNILDTNLLKSILSQPRKEAPIEEKPEIVLSPTISSNPTFYYVRDSSWTFTIALEAKNGSATILEDRCLSVEKNNGEGLVYSGGTWENSGNPTTRLTGSPIALSYGGSIKKGYASYLSVDTDFVYIKIEFANDNGKPQKPFERMYFVDKHYLNKTLREAHSDEFEKVKKYLVGIRKW